MKHWTAFSHLFSGIQRQGLNTELDDVETRLEEYPMTLAFLHLLDVLTDRYALWFWHWKGLTELPTGNQIMCSFKVQIPNYYCINQFWCPVLSCYIAWRLWKTEAVTNPLKNSMLVWFNFQGVRTLFHHMKMYVYVRRLIHQGAAHVLDALSLNEFVMKETDLLSIQWKSFPFKI